jgi:hypothetical protein
MNLSLQYLLARAREPSTWAGAGVGAVVIHSFAPGALGDALVAVAASLAALAAIVVPETPQTKGDAK